MLVSEEPTPFCPPVLRSESSPKLPPAFVLVHAATGPGISSPSGVITIDCGIPRPLSSIITLLPLRSTEILFANLKLVRIASSTELSIISSISLITPATYVIGAYLPKRNRSWLSFETLPIYIPGRRRACSLSVSILISLLIINKFLYKHFVNIFI